MKFAENLRALMAVHKLSQEKLAEKLNTSQATISRWINEVNQPDFETLFLICEILDSSPDELLGWKE